MIYSRCGTIFKYSDDFQLFVTTWIVFIWFYVDVDTIV